MSIPDWQNPDVYLPLAQLTGAQWAWQFLRRNPRYQAEWQAFDVTWQALESAYGRPPNRDFCAWKQDPRAWVAASQCEQTDCRVGEDKVLIECALGARWGFHKFPPDPAIDDAVGDGLLTWRESPRTTVVVDAQDGAWLGAEASRVAIGFDLSRPLRDQIEQAKRTLQVLQRRRRNAGDFEMASARHSAPAFSLMVRLLDGQASAADEAGLRPIDPDWRRWLERAVALRDGGYRELVQLPD
jgi:hypothetical protein